MKEYPFPTARQEEWADMEIGVIIHHCMETYHPEIPAQLWKKSREEMPATSFAPMDADTDQWISTAAKMGAKYAVLVANHTSGFSLWPTKENDYSIKKSPWKNGEGDIVRDFVESCVKYGIRPGLYYSIVCNTFYGINDDEKTDYRSDKYKEYLEMVIHQLTEIWSEYGEMFEIWFDGGIVPTEVGGPDILSLLKKYQPNAICFQGPAGYHQNLRWVGNENGLAPMNCWSTIGADSVTFGDTEVQKTGAGDPEGGFWVPAETDMASRKQNAMGGGWYWREGEENLVYTAEELLERYMTSVGRNSNLLLGMCIDKHGNFPAEDSKQFIRFGEMVRELFKYPVSSCRGTGTEFTMHLNETSYIRNMVIAEDIHYGQRIRNFNIEIEDDNGWRRFYEAKSVGHKRIIPINEKISGVRFSVDQYVDIPIVRECTLYR